MTRVAVFISTALGVGYFPIAPGTFGSLAGLVVLAGVRQSGSGFVEAAALVLVGGAGVWAAARAERYFGSTDPGPVVIDEVFGMLVTLAFMPLTWPTALGGFLLFRALDIVKPYPAGRAERLPGGLGVMADDGLAAIYANVVLRAAVWMMPGWFL